MERKEWFADWFNTPYYHILYKDRDDREAERFIGNLVTQLRIPKGANVLDLACGRGRHSVMLHALGYDVLGVDLSANSIAHASKMASTHLDFEVHDMRFPLPNRKFAAVFNLFTSFGYFDGLKENEKVLRSVAEMLIPGGIFVIDFMNSEKVIRTLVKREEKTVDGIVFNIHREFNGNHIFKHIEFEDLQKKFSYTERVQSLTLSDFKSMLSEADFQILHTFGDFNLRPFESSSSDRLIFIAQKH